MSHRLKLLLTQAAKITLLLTFGHSEFLLADAQSDLMRALDKLKGTQSATAQFKISTWSKLGEDDEAIEKQGSLELNISDSASGLNIEYSKALLKQMAEEEKRKSKNPNTDTPALETLWHFNAKNLNNMISASESLKHTLERGTFLAETLDTFEGKQYRKLSYSFPIDTLEARQRKYIKKFKHIQDYWITADGVPVASETRIKASGRAFIFITFKLRTNTKFKYEQVGDRLVIREIKNHHSQSGSGEEYEAKQEKTLFLSD